MCGIFGYVGEENASTLVLNGLAELEYRGYDSWGIAYEREGLEVVKQVGRLASARPALPVTHAALGHTRWATHGGVTQANAHPHRDCAGRLAVIHNGIITNHLALRAELARSSERSERAVPRAERRSRRSTAGPDRRNESARGLAGHTFRSETDSEVVAHLLETGASLIDVFRRLEGSNAVAVLAGGRIAAAKNGSPLVLGWADHGAFIASDPAALAPHTRRVTYVEDGQAVLADRHGFKLFDISTGAEITPRISEFDAAHTAPDLAGWPDHMSREIAEQPAVLRRLAADTASTARLAAELAAAEDLVITGCGSAYLAGLAGQYALSQAGLRATCVAASELPSLPALIRPGTLVLALSQSGETIDVLDAVRAARQRGARVAALVNVPGSSLWRAADTVVPLGAGPERAVLATKSFTAQLAALVLAAQGSSARPLIERAADEIEKLLEGPARARLTALAAELAPKAHLFLIGRGASYPLALEAALKIKEVSYLHAEGFAGGELKHGVIALMEPGTPVLVLAPSGPTYDDALSGGMEVRARGARLIGLSSDPHPAFDSHIPIADLGAATGLVHAAAAQLIGYDLARRAGHDPDRPRHLAKSVTVR